MTTSLSWHLKLASLSWVHTRFCATQFVQLIKTLPKNPTWSLIQQRVASGPLLGTNIRWDKVDLLEEELLTLLQSHGQLVCPLDKEFPTHLRYRDKVPALLSYFGSAVWNQSPSLAVVGARKIDPDSKTWMNRELRDLLSASPCCIVSGGAVGVDQASHCLALRSGSPTIIVLPSGLLNPYPSTAKSLIETVSNKGGAVVSAFPPLSQAKSSHFHRRNRLLVQMSDSLLVIQAARRSGSHMSALLALEQGLDVGVVPGHPSQAGFLANLDLIHDGARVVRHAEDILGL